MAATLKQGTAIASALSTIQESIRVGNDQINQRVSELATALEELAKQRAAEAEETAKMVSDLKGKVQSHEDKLFSMLGGGDGETGSVNEMRKEQYATRIAIADMNTSVKLIEERTKDIGKTKSFVDGWHGIKIAITVVGSCAAVGTLVVAVVKMVMAIIHGS